MKLEGHFLTTGIGSIPYRDAKKSAEEICEHFDIPFWPQLPKRGFKENMYVQFSEGLPFTIIDEKNKKIYVDTSKDLSEGLAKIYEVYISGHYDSLGLTKEFSEGFYVFLDIAKKYKKKYIKGQVTGPLSFGLSVVDEKGKSIIYHESLKDALLKLLEIKALWQIEKLKDVSEEVVIFIDEPYLTGFGSSYVSIERQDIIAMLQSMKEAIHKKGALCGVHCCGNTDWSILVDAGIDIINFDAYSYMESLLLYTTQIGSFLKKGGYVAWGIVPTGEVVLKETAESLSQKLSAHIEKLEKKKIPKDLIISHSLLTPSCGMGTLSENLAERIISIIAAM